ncbi:hypothetical protein N7465_000261 [Penicillium sp. CMV-2018d]|nr:hypothetical protein N7465_000261 [Penicillium sp. CMV-2018d]
MSSTFERSGIFVSSYGLAANRQTSKPDRGVMIDTSLFFRALVYLWWEEDAAATGVPADENPLPDDSNDKFLYYINLSLEGFAEPPNYSFHNQWTLKTGSKHGNLPHDYKMQYGENGEVMPPPADRGGSYVSVPQPP